MRDEQAEQRQDRDWHELQVELACKARYTCGHMVTNTSLTIEQLADLFGKANSRPLRRYPAGQARLVGLKFEHIMAFTGQRGLIATIEYSPLGWPDIDAMHAAGNMVALAEADLNVLFQETQSEPVQSTARRNFL